MDKILFVHFVISGDNLGVVIHVLLKWHKWNNVHLLSVTLRWFVGLISLTCFLYFWGWGYVPLEKFSLITREGLQILTYTRQPWPLSCGVLFNMPHLLWHGASASNGHLRGPVTLPPFADPRERLTVELSPPVLWLKSVAAGIQTPTLTCSI